MSALSDYLEQKLNDHVLGGVTYTPPATVHIALFTGAPSDAGGGTEVAGGSYARAAVTNNATNFPATAQVTGIKSNGTAIVFAEATADWGLITHFGFFDQSSGGNLLYQAALDNQRNVLTGDTLQFAAGSLKVTFA